MICVRQGLRKYKYKDKHKDKYKYKDKYKNNRQTYDVICLYEKVILVSENDLFLTLGLGTSNAKSKTTS